MRQVFGYVSDVFLVAGALLGGLMAIGLAGGQHTRLNAWKALKVTLLIATVTRILK